MSETVLITGARSAAALDLARVFSQAGYKVHMADSSMACVARFSKIPVLVHHYASPRFQLKQFVSDIESIIKNLEPSIIVPTCEEIFYLSQSALQKTINGRLFAPDLKNLRELHDKNLFIELCRRLDIKTPETHSLTHIADLQPYQNDSDHWVLKPCFTRFGSQTIFTPSVIDFTTLSVSPSSPWVAQRRIYGEEMSFYAIAKEGQIAALSAYKSEWRLKGGASYVFSSVDSECETQLREIAQKIASGISLTGQFSCDVIRDENGQIWPIECNPRATSGVHMLVGQNIITNAILGKNNITTASVKTKYLLPVILICGLKHALSTGAIAKWFSILRDGQDVIGKNNDRWPLFGALIDTAGFLWVSLRYKISLRQATTHDIEWNGENFI